MDLAGFRLAAPIGTDRRLAISADGTRIVLASEENGVSRLYARRADDVAFTALSRSPRTAPASCWRVKRTAFRGSMPVARMTWRSRHSPAPRARGTRPCLRTVTGSPSGGMVRSEESRWPVVPYCRYPPGGFHTGASMGPSSSPSREKASIGWRPPATSQPLSGPMRTTTSPGLTSCPTARRSSFRVQGTSKPGPSFSWRSVRERSPTWASPGATLSTPRRVISSSGTAARP